MLTHDCSSYVADVYKPITLTVIKGGHSREFPCFERVLRIAPIIGGNAKASHAPMKSEYKRLPRVV
jgi:hypothetical protein